MLHLVIAQTVNGIVTGNIYGLIAVGLALIFGAAAMVNFAHGSVYMAGADVGWLSVTRLHLPFLPSLGIAVAACALLGLLMERIVVRRILGTSHLAPLLATLGVSFILDQASQLIFGPSTQAFPSPIPRWQVTLGGVAVSSMDIIILSVSVASAGALWALLRLTKIGWAIRAVAQDRDAARQVGVRVEVVNQATFAVASALGGVAGILVAIYFNSVSPTMGFNAMLKGFVAELLGGMASIPGAIAGGHALGIVESWGVALLGSSYRDLFAYVILIVMLLVRPNGLFGGKGERLPEPMTGTLARQSRAVRIPRPLAVAFIALRFLFPIAVRNPYILQILINSWLFGLLALSLTLVSGTVGQISLGHAGLLAIGGYTSALLAMRTGLPVFASIPLAGIVTAGLATLLVYPTFRLRSHYLAIATLAIGEIVRLVVLNWGSLTQGAMGLPNIPPLSIGGFQVVDPQSLYWAALILLFLIAFLQTRLVRSPVGRAFKAIRDDEIAAQSYGVGLNRYKALAFGFSGFTAGIAGVFTAHMYSYINHETFTNTTSILGLTMGHPGGPGQHLGRGGRVCRADLRGLPGPRGREPCSPCGKHRVPSRGKREWEVHNDESDPRAPEAEVWEDRFR